MSERTREMIEGVTLMIGLLYSLKARDRGSRRRGSVKRRRRLRRPVAGWGGVGGSRCCCPLAGRRGREKEDTN